MPQLFASLWTSVHWGPPSPPGQTCWPMSQHRPCMHVWFMPHALSHVPQLLTSVCVSTHAFMSQSVVVPASPIGHTIVHAPFTHCHLPPPGIAPPSPPPQTVPHFPQLARSLFVS